MIMGELCGLSPPPPGKIPSYVPGSLGTNLQLKVLTSGDIVLTSGEEDESSTWIKGRTVSLAGKTGKKVKKKQFNSIQFNKDHKCILESKQFTIIPFKP